ncbi:MAG: DUF1398 domain-containing protein [Ignavibacteria bacterium]|nr:DUF1398 domain-containing protein [Ignavibacteria bacterium]
MFTLEQIKSAHGKVRSGADFPAYIQEIKKLGVTNYESFVSDGHIDYYGEDDFKTTSPAKYDEMEIADDPDIEQFKSDIKAHQEGRTDFPVFCKDCANSGVEKWTVNINEMTCTYYDKTGNVILTEEIPG